MTRYTAPVQDMQFLLHDVLNVTGSDIPGYADLDEGFTAAVLEEAGKIATDVLAPLNAVGDAEGCTLENQEFSQLLPQFLGLGAVVAGISPDSVESHCSFRDKFALKVTLLADPDLSAVQAFGLWQLKKLWGVEYMGLVRTSFIIDPEGRIVAMLKATRIRGHAQKVLDAAIQMHGALGVSQHTPLAHMYAQQRTLRLADGPDEVHHLVVGRSEIQRMEGNAGDASMLQVFRN